MNGVVANALAGAAGAGNVANTFSPVNTGLLGVAIVLLGMVLRHQFSNRKLTTEVNGELRAEFIEEMHALREEVKGLRGENESLRREVRDLHGIIDGMRRENLGAQTSAQRVIAGILPHSPEIERALDSLGNVQGDTRT